MIGCILKFETIFGFKDFIFQKRMYDNDLYVIIVIYQFKFHPAQTFSLLQVDFFSKPINRRCCPDLSEGFFFSSTNTFCNINYSKSDHHSINFVAYICIYIYILTPSREHSVKRSLIDFNSEFSFSSISWNTEGREPFLL